MSDLLVPEPRTYPNCSSLRGIKVLEKHRAPQRTIIEAEWDIAEDPLLNCPRCYDAHPDYHSKGPVKHDEVRDRPVANRPLLINIACKKYRCQDCGETFGVRHPGMRKSSSLTEALVKHIVHHAEGDEHAENDETFASIARRTGIDESTVRKHFENKADKSERLKGTGRHWHAPQALGVDGVDVGHTRPGETDPDKDGLSTIILSLEDEGGTPIELLPTDNAGPLRDFLEDDIVVTDRRLPIVIDMDDTYRSAIEAANLPTVIVVDRYHITRKANLALRDAKSDLLGKAMKRVWKKRKAKLKNAKSEDPDAGRQTTILDEAGPDNEHNLPQEIKTMELVLKAGWRFHSIMTRKDLSPNKARSRYQDWENRLDPSIRGYYQTRVIKTMQGRWREQIFNYFLYPYTNGPVEAENSRAKDLEREGAGYTNRTMRIKICANDPVR